MSTNLMTVGDTFAGSQAYIYILFSKEQHALYVGQTNEQNGVIGRLSGHLSAGGTFRVRLHDQLGICLQEVLDLCLFSYTLPREPRYTGVDRAYREGVEWLVHTSIAAERSKIKPFVQVISRVNYSDAAALGSVRVIAQEIVKHFRVAYERC